MAVTNWVGGDSGGTTDWTIAANWDNGVPGSGDDAVIGNVTHDPTIPDGTDPTLGSIQVATGGQLTAGNNVITLDDVDGSGFAFYLNGTGAFVKGTSTITFTNSSNQYIAINTSNANRTFYNVTVNKTGSGDVYIYQSRDGSSNEPLVISNNLTISARGLSTANDASSPSTYFDLTVEGSTSITGTLTCNTSTVSLGSGTSSGYAVAVNNGGTFTGGSGTHTIGAISMLAGSNTTFTSGVTTFDSHDGGNITIAWTGTFDDGNGTVTFTRAGNQYLHSTSNAAITLYNVIVNHSSCNVQWRQTLGASLLTIATDLTITAGTFNTSEETAGTSRNLTVAGNTTIGKGASAGGADEATLTCNASTVSLGSTYSSDYGLYVKRGGTFVGGTGEHTMGSISMEDYATAKLTLTTHANGTTLNAGDYGSDYIVAVGADSTITSTNSLLVLATSKTEATYNLNLHDHFNNLTVNSSGKKFYIQQATTLAGNFTITAGDVDTTGSNHAITVTKHIDITGILTGNASAISTGTMTLRDNSSLVSTGTITITGNDKANSPSGAGFIWRNIETDGTAFAPTAGKVHFSGTDNNGGYIFESKFHDVDVTLASTGQDVAMSGVVGDLITIGGDLTVIEGTLKRNSEAHDITVTGDVEVQDGGVLGDNDETGATSFGSLTISSGGTYKATSGITTLNGNFTMSSDTATFTHNSGTVEIANNCELLPTDFDSSETARHVFNNVTQSAGTFYLERPCKIEGNYTKSGGDLVHYTKCTMGTTSASSTLTVNSGEWKMYGYYGSPYLYAASELKPINITGSVTDPINWDNVDSVTRDTYIYIKGINYQKDTTTGGNGARIVLDGDCEFDAVTVSSGDTLDLNGQRAKFDGDFTLASGTPVLKLADSMFICTGDVEWNGKIPTSNANTILWHNVSGEKTWRSNYSEGTFFCDGAPSTAATKVHSYAWNQTYTDKLIVGTGIFNNDSINIGASTKIAVADGGNFTAGGSSIIESAGTISFSGGLIGKSAYDFNGAASGGGFINCGSHADIANIFDSGGTVEAWIRIDGDAGTASGMRPFSKDKWFVSVDNDASGDVYKLRLYQFFSGDNGVWSSTNAVLSKDKWHHIAITYNNGATTNDPIMYVNGEQVAITETGEPTGTFDADGSDELYLGNREDGARTFNGVIGMARLFDDIRTVGELRTDMFNAYAEMSSTHLLKAMYQFDEGTSTALENVANAGTADGTITANSSAWVGEGEYSKASSTIKTTANGAELWLKSGVTDINNLDIDGNTTIYTLGGTNFKLMGDLDVAASKDIAYAGQIKLFNSGETFTFGTPATAVKDVTSFSTREAGTFTIPEVTINKLFMDTADSIIVQSGDHTYNAELEINTGATFNANGNTLTSKLIDMNGTGTLNINNSTLKFSATDGLTSTSTNTLSAGTTTTIEGNSKASKSTFESQNNFVVVGNVKYLDVTNEELKVTGGVTDCTGLIHQMHPTQDADQQLDKDTADDRDVQFASLNMDRNTELVG